MKPVAGPVRASEGALAKAKADGEEMGYVGGGTKERKLMGGATGEERGDGEESDEGE